MNSSTPPNKLTIQNRREKIYNAARGLFFKKGYRHTTIGQIVEKAGYSKRSFYLDFESKDDLFLTIALDGLEEHMLSPIRSIPAGELDLPDYLDRIVDTTLAFAFEQPDYLKLLVADITPDIIENGREETLLRAREVELEGFGMIAREVERYIHQGDISSVDPLETAVILAGHIAGTIMLSMVANQVAFQKKSLELTIKQGCRLICMGMMAEKVAAIGRLKI